MTTPIRPIDNDDLAGPGEFPGPSDLVAQQAAIAHIGQRALEERSQPELLSEACDLIGRVLGAELVSIAELSPRRDSARVVAGIGWRPGIVGELDLGTGAESQAGFTLTTGEPVVVDDYATEHRFRVVDSLGEHNVRAGITVRIGGSQTPYGTIGAFTTRPRRFTPDDANFLRAVANVLAAAVGRMSIERELRASRDQLAAIVATIDEGVTVRAGDQLIFANDEAARLTGFESAAELLNAPELVDQFEMFAEDGRPLPAEQLPSRRARAGENAPESVVGFRNRASSETRWSLVRGVGLHDDDGQISSVISIFRDITEERWARITREYMADAVAVLSTTLDTVEAAQRLADLAVPQLADYCTVSILQDDDSISLVALSHVNPERVQLIRELQQILPPPDLNSETGAGRVIRESTIERGTVTPQIIDALPLPDDQRQVLLQLELRSYVTVPLSGRQRPIGALTLAMAESGRTITDREVALAVELGARAGIALENARLYQAADARRAELAAVLAALAEAVVVFDGRGVLRLGNQAARRIFNDSLPLTIAELRARVGLDTDGDDQQGDGDTGPGRALEVDVDGEGRWHEMRTYMTNVDTGESPTVIVLRDITEVRAARAARDAFMGVLSHELRTPITTIYGGSELLSRDLGDEQRAEVIADIRGESERLARLVEDLLVMTRVERGIVEIADEPILLQHLLSRVITATASRWPGARITLRAADRLSAVRGDPTYIEQVVRNLLTNAMRYGAGLENGIDVIAQEEPDKVVVRVLDRGKGFGEEGTDRLFDLFYRATSARSVPGGAGIGLFVCRNLIEAMGGEIWARERPSGGAEFGFWLPILDSDAPA